jgi:cytochrome c2
VPDAVRDSYELPPFPVDSITNEPAFEDTINWLEAQGAIDARAEYATSVNTAFLDAIAPDAVATETTGDPADGELVFEENGCDSCHSLEEGVDGAGPSLAGIANIAAERVEGQSAEEYLYEAIVNPSAHIVEGYNDIMPAYDTLGEQNLNDLIAYLMTLD